MDLIVNLFHSGFSAVVPFIILLGILIFVHELGHFLVAKYFGVRVEVFSLGFGKKILQYKKGDTTYCISLIPLGGYVKMYGDEVGSNVPENQKQFSFSHKPVGQRIGVVLAGPLMNFFFAVVLYFAIALVGEEVRGPFLGDVDPSTKAHAVGFRSGDRVVSVEGKEIKSWDDVQHHINTSTGSELSFVVKHEGSSEAQTIKVAPVLKPNPNVLSLEPFAGEIEGFTFLSRATFVAITPGSIAEKLGIKSGDRLLKVNGNSVSFFRNIEKELKTQLAKGPVNLFFERNNVDGKTNGTYEVTISPEIVKTENLMTDIGFENPDIFIGKVMPDSPALAAGLQAGDKILKVNNVEPKRWEDILNSIKGYEGTGAVQISVLRGAETIKFDITPKITSQMSPTGSEEKRFTVGIAPIIQSAPPETVVVKADGIGHALVKGTKKTIDLSVMTVVSFLRLIQNKISPKNIGGPISIGQIASESFKMGWMQFVQIMGVISINLFVLNLLPVPVLDGGHLLFYTLEAIRGAPVSMRKMEIAQQVGLVLLMSLMVFALFNDFSRLFGAL